MAPNSVLNRVSQIEKGLSSLNFDENQRPGSANSHFKANSGIVAGAKEKFNKIDSNPEKSGGNSEKVTGTKLMTKVHQF
jgi:hypothetical protein